MKSHVSPGSRSALPCGSVTGLPQLHSPTHLDARSLSHRAHHKGLTGKLLELTNSLKTNWSSNQHNSQLFVYNTPLSLGKKEVDSTRGSQGSERDPRRCFLRVTAEEGW